MKKCLETCHKLNTSCPVEECRYWINFEQDRNCVFESIDKNDSMTLREIADRLGISYVRVKQIQDKTLKKISHLLKS
jgi:hypothetical protein